ncbi:MAG: hypothetical protein NVSMB25_05650 [Thermoleophilaceae bacterium]
MEAPPDSLEALVKRFDPEPFDARDGRARIRLEVRGEGAWDVTIRAGEARLGPAGKEAPEAELSADRATWRRIVRDVSGGMAAFRAGRLGIRRNLHLGAGFLAATNGDRAPGRLRFETHRTKLGRVSTVEAGSGPPLLLLHGLGATKASFLPTIAAVAPAGYRTIAVDLPGFGDSDKPFPGRYDARFFARWTLALLDALELERTHLLGHSMGGRVALEVAMHRPERVGGLILMTPSLAWRSAKPWAPYLRFVRPELGILQPTPRSVVEGVVRKLVPGGDSEWTRIGVDEFLRAFLDPRGRVAFYAAARQIYLEQGEGPDGFWKRLEELAPRSLFLWGRRDQLVPIKFAEHVRRAVPSARHVELDCGHVPQLESPAKTHAAILSFLHSQPAADGGEREAAVRLAR